jgi:hypothetical protein
MPESMPDKYKAVSAEVTKVAVACEEAHFDYLVLVLDRHRSDLLSCAKMQEFTKLETLAILTRIMNVDALDVWAIRGAYSIRDTEDSR